MPATPNHEGFQYAERIRRRLLRAVQPQRIPIHPMKYTLTIAREFLRSSWRAVRQHRDELLRRLSPLRSSSLRSALTVLLLAPLTAPPAAETALVPHDWDAANITLAKDCF